MPKPPRDPEKLKNVKDKCDKCPYVPKNLADFIAHLKEKHPEGGDPRPR